MAYIRQQQIAPGFMERRRSLSDRLKEEAASAAIRGGIGLVGMAGEKVLGNIFQKGGAAERALTPQVTLDARDAAAKAALQAKLMETEATSALRDKRRAEIDMFPIDAELKRAQTAKAREEARLKPEREKRKRKELSLEFKNKEEERKHDFALEAFKAGLNLNRDAEKTKDAKELKRLDADLKRQLKRFSANAAGTYILRNGRKVTGKQFFRQMNILFKQAQEARASGDSPRYQSLMGQLQDHYAANEMVDMATPAARLDTRKSEADLKATQARTARDIAETGTTGLGFDQEQREAFGQQAGQIVDEMGRGPSPRQPTDAQKLRAKVNEFNRRVTPGMTPEAQKALADELGLVFN